MTVYNPGVGSGGTGGGGGPLVPASGTTLPSSPANGLEYFWYVDSTNGKMWHMRYEGVTLNKWLFLGGMPMYNNVETSETRATASYGDMATVGPSLTAPAAGVYAIAFGATLSESVASQSGLMSVDLAGAGAIDADAVFAGNNASTAAANFGGLSRKLEKTLAAPLTVVCKYKPTTAANMTASRRWLELLPIRIDPT